jgi:hypothetical protein
MNESVEARLMGIIHTMTDDSTCMCATTEIKSRQQFQHVQPYQLNMLSILNMLNVLTGLAFKTALRAGAVFYFVVVFTE